jgi:hypothetical protein
MDRAPMKSAEIAERLGIAVKTFYVQRHRLHVIDKMPRPISEVGQPKWERNGMEAWLTRNDRRLPQVKAANDAIAPPMPSNDAEWTAFLHQHYHVEPAE